MTTENIVNAKKVPTSRGERPPFFKLCFPRHRVSQPIICYGVFVLFVNFGSPRHHFRGHSDNFGCPRPHLDPQGAEGPKNVWLGRVWEDFSRPKVVLNQVILGSFQFNCCVLGYLCVIFLGSLKKELKWSSPRGCTCNPSMPVHVS